MDRIEGGDAFVKLIKCLLKFILCNIRTHPVDKGDFERARRDVNRMLTSFKVAELAATGKGVQKLFCMVIEVLYQGSDIIKFVNIYTSFKARGVFKAVSTRQMTVFEREDMAYQFTDTAKKQDARVVSASGQKLPVSSFPCTSDFAACRNVTRTAAKTHDEHEIVFESMAADDEREPSRFRVSVTERAIFDQLSKLVATF
ncbi:hypothetical protein FOA52_007630 [Chlamydomonas sp. UWO 241]|nr:hypothetical protein FOA52_007630 [Chlamydomonas sp. UWO 241]